MKEIVRTFGFILAVMVCVLTIDFVVGKILDKMLTELPHEGEKVAKSNYVINGVDSDILIVGSSRAQCHYVVEEIQKVIPDKSVFNCGVDGSLFLYQSVVINCILDRYSPELIIWDLQYSDLANDSNKENLGLLYPYYWQNDFIRKFLNGMDSELKYKIWLNSYRYNSTAVRILRVKGMNTVEHHGYAGRIGTDVSRHIAAHTVPMECNQLDGLKVDIMQGLISKAKSQGVNLILVHSPYYNTLLGKSSTTQKIEELSDDNGVIFINDAQLPEIVGKTEFVYDENHLNSKGAKLFTSILLSQMAMAKNDIETCNQSK